MEAEIQAEAVPQAEPRRIVFAFTGTAVEYFGIWIVNLLLSIVTLGIYTAWAKVRRLRYFYGNTWLDDHNFEYHARPVQILIGRIIVVAVLLAYFGLTALSPAFTLLLIPYLIALPWLINKAMAFNARMTSYRNVRLSFAGSYGRAFVVFVLLPLLLPLTLGLLAPVVSRASSRYIGDNLRFGTARFQCDPALGTLYANFGATILFAIVTALAIGMAGFGIGSLLGISGLAELADVDTELVELLAAGGIFGAIIGAYVAVFLAFLFYAAGVRNIAFNAAVLDGKHRFASNIGRARYVWILVTNLVATILSIGLLRPWAAVRTWRYLADHTGVEAHGSLDEFVDTAAPEGRVAAAEYFDIEGIDFGL